MNAPDRLMPLLDFKTTTWSPTGTPGVRYEKRPARPPDGSGRRPLQRLDHARQPRRSSTPTPPTW